MLKPLTLIFTLIILFSCHSKQKDTFFSIGKIDSIQKRIDTLEIDSNFFYLKKIDSFLNKNNQYPDSLKAENNFLLGKEFEKRNNTDSAAHYYIYATDLVKKPINNRKGLYFQKAYYLYSNKELYGNCLTLSKKYRSLLDSTNQPKDYTWSLHWEKDTYLKMGNYPKAMEKARRIVKYVEKNDTNNITYAIIGLAKLEYNLNNKKRAFGIFDSLIKNTKIQSHNDIRSLNATYGIYQYYEKDYKKALKHYLIACKAAKRDSNSVNFFNNLANSYNNIAEVYMDLRELELSAKYLDSVKQFGFNNLNRNVQKELLKYELRLSVLSQKNLNRAYNIIDSINSYQDNVYREKLENELVALTKLSEKELSLTKQKQTAELKNVNLKNVLVITGIVTISMILITFLFYQKRKINYEKTQLQTQQKLLSSQMSSHFTFNTLNAIENKINQQPKDASSLLIKFSRLLQTILDSSTKNFNLLEKELYGLRQYMDLLLVRLPNSFSYEISLKNMDEEDIIFIPPMLLQPFIENSIIHGFKEINYKGEIKITLEKQKKNLKCIIEDNGRGYEKKENKINRKSSIQLINEFLKKNTKKGIQYGSFNNAKMKGTIVTFLIPYKLIDHD